MSGILSAVGGVSNFFKLGPPLIVNADCGYIHSCQLDSTRSLVIYTDNANGFYPTAVVLTVSNGVVISAGTPVVITAAAAFMVTCDAINSSTAVVGWKGTYPYVMILSISESTITLNSVVAGWTAYVDLNGIVLKVTHPNRCVMLFTSTIGANAYMSSFSISGTTITYYSTWGTGIARGGHHSICRIDDDRVLLGIADHLNNQCYGIVATFSAGGSAALSTLGSALNFYASISYPNWYLMNSSTALVVYGQSSGNPTARLINISGSSLTSGNAISITNATHITNRMSSVSIVNADTFLVLFNHNTTDDAFYVILKHSAGNLSAGQPVGCMKGVLQDTYYEQAPVLHKLSDGAVMIVYKNKFASPDCVAQVAHGICPAI